MSDYLSQSTCLEMLHPKTDEHVNPSVEVHHLVGKLSTAETLVTEVQSKIIVINVCNQGRLYAHPVYNILFFLAIHIWKYIFRVLNSRRIRLAVHVARMEEKKDVHKVLVGKPLGRPSRRWEENIKLAPQEVGCGVMAQDKDH